MDWTTVVSTNGQTQDPLELLLFFILPLPHYTQHPPLPSLVLSAAAARSGSSLPDCAAVVKQRGKRERQKHRNQKKGRYWTGSRGLDRAGFFPEWCICSLTDLLLLFPFRGRGWKSVWCHFCLSFYHFFLKLSSRSITCGADDRNMLANMTKHASHMHEDANICVWELTRRHCTNMCMNTQALTLTYTSLMTAEVMQGHSLMSPMRL